MDIDNLRVSFKGADSLSSKLCILISSDHRFAPEGRRHVVVEDYPKSYRASVFYTEAELMERPSAQRAFEGIMDNVDFTAGEMAWLVQQGYIIKDNGDFKIDLKKAKADPRLEI